MIFRDDMLVVKFNELLNLEIEGDSKIVIDSYNKKSDIFSSIMLLMENIGKIIQNFVIIFMKKPVE